MKIIHGRAGGIASESRTKNCTGTVWGDAVMPTTDGVTVNNVFFTPGGRTHWHSHEFGQLLQVTAGSGWVCTEGGERQVIRTGDMVWIPPNERHWHGGSSDSYMIHLATTVGPAGSFPHEGPDVIPRGRADCDGVHDSGDRLRRRWHQGIRAR